MDHSKKYFVIAALLGASAVALGAFGAHGLKNLLMSEPDFLKRFDWWQKASYYHLTHGILAFILAQYVDQKIARIGFILTVVGILIFSGSLYIMTLTNMRFLGAVTPIGGLCLILAWGSVMGIKKD